MAKTARTDYLRMQLEAIREELGESPAAKGVTKSPEAKGSPRSCSFCAKLERDVEKLITGPNVCICNECIVRFADLLT